LRFFFTASLYDLLTIRVLIDSFSFFVQELVVWVLI